MRLLITALFIMSLSATANAVVVTFEDATEPFIGSGPGDPAADDFITTPQGFNFGFQGESNGNYFPLLSDSNGNTYMHSIQNPGAPGGMVVWRPDGQLFDLSSIDLHTRSGAYPQSINGGEYDQLWSRSASEVIAYAADHSIIGMWSSDSLNTNTLDWYTVTFDSEWSDIQTLVIRKPDYDGTPINPVLYDSIKIDNFTATVVPVPAAAWLFLSGLSVLGFRRRVR